MFASFADPMTVLAGFLGLLVLFLAWRLHAQGQARRTEEALQQERLAQGQAQWSELQQRCDLLAGDVEQWRNRAQADALLRTRAEAALDEKQQALVALQEGFQASRAALKSEFEQLAHQVLDEKSRRFAESGRSEFMHLLQPFREQVEQFRQRVNEVHDASLKGQSRLSAEIEQVRALGLHMSAEAHALSTALRGDKKTVGNWGEMQLERSLQLAGLVKEEHYRSQAAWHNEAGQRRLPDFVILLPDGKHMILDSKVSLVAWEQAVSADTAEGREQALSAHVQALRQNVTDLASKDYARLIGLRSPGFVLMFLPVEPAYIEALRQDKQLFDWAYRQNVVLVSHTTLMPILRTVASLWMLARSNEQARALSDQAGDLSRQVTRVAERLHRLGQTLNTAVGHYNGVVKAVAGQQGLTGKVSRFSALSIRASQDMPDLNTLQADIDVQRLADVLPVPDAVAPDPDAPESVAPTVNSAP